MSASPIPAGLLKVSAFINTFDDGVESLLSPDALRHFLVAEGWGRPPVDDDTLARAIEVREALRALAHANNGGEPDANAVRVLDRAAARSRVALRFGRDGSGLRPEARGVDAALGEMLAIVHHAMHDGTWSRFKACRADDCRWAFYDLSKNQSATWCSMRTCGNRNKARRFRARHGA